MLPSGCTPLAVATLSFFDIFAALRNEICGGDAFVVADSFIFVFTDALEDQRGTRIRSWIGQGSRT